MLVLIALQGCLYIDDDLHADRLEELRPEDTIPTPDTGTPPTDDTGPTTVEPLGPPIIDSIGPTFGTTAGGTSVTLVGGPFRPGDTPLEVRFGGVASLITSVDATTLVVDSPPAASEGPVLVTVTTSGGEATAPDSYTYWPDATGKTGATGELVWFQYVGDIWGPQEGTGYGRSTVRFTQPITDYQFFKNWAPELDTCAHWANEVPEYEYDITWTSIDALVGQLVQTSATATIDLEWNQAEVRFTNYDLIPAQIVPGDTYDLSLQGTTGLPELDLPGVFPVPAPFFLTSPRIDSPNPPDVFADHQFEWSTDEEGDAILLQVGLLNNAGDAFQEELHCAIRDVGSFYLPSEQWLGWAPGRQVHVLIGRYNSGIGVLPWNQGRIAVASQLWYYGIGMSQ